jgi:hypothetical protein
VTIYSPGLSVFILVAGGEVSVHSPTVGVTDDHPVVSPVGVALLLVLQPRQLASTLDSVFDRATEPNPVTAITVADDSEGDFVVVVIHYRYDISRC